MDKLLLYFKQTLAVPRDDDDDDDELFVFSLFTTMRLILTKMFHQLSDVHILTKPSSW